MMLSLSACNDSNSDPNTNQTDKFGGKTADFSATFAPQNVSEYFSETFTEADYKFVQACAIANGKLAYFDHPLLGPNGEPLRVVVCHQYRTGDEQNVLLTLSGIHGVEGFLGSAMQIGMLLNPELHTLSDNWRIVHIHMLNPYGAAWMLKEDENNVDVLKNIEALYKQNMDTSILVNFIDRLDIPNFDQPEVQQAGHRLFAEFVATYGQRLTAALQFGQSTWPTGLVYIGQEEVWASQAMKSIAARYLSQTQKIFLFDLHTAFGHHGKWTAMGIDAFSKETFERWLGEEKEVSVISSPFYSGDISFYDSLRLNTSALMVRGFFEVGTYPETDYQAYFVSSLYCRFHAQNKNSDLCRFSQQQVREFFYPSDSQWRQSAWNDFIPMTKRIITGLNQWQ